MTAVPPSGAPKQPTPHKTVVAKPSDQVYMNITAASSTPLSTAAKQARSNTKKYPIGHNVTKGQKDKADTVYKNRIG